MKDKIKNYSDGDMTVFCYLEDEPCEAIVVINPYEKNLIISPYDAIRLAKLLLEAACDYNLNHIMDGKGSCL